MASMVTFHLIACVASIIYEETDSEAKPSCELAWNLSVNMICFFLSLVAIVILIFNSVEERKKIEALRYSL
jgi:hypothetical protein